MSFFKGWFGEKKTSLNLWLSLDAKVYQRYQNVIIPSSNGTTQIDHLLVSPFGLFIVETKNKKGWIFGSKDKPKWTQSIYGNNYLFQNPLRQTYRQKKVLTEYLRVIESQVHTVIFFNGDCRFKTRMPENVINSNLGNYIKRFRNPVIEPSKLDQIIAQLELHKSYSDLTNKDHRQSLYARRSSNTTCPKCGANLVERMARKGANAGSKFMGCENYPKCRFTKNTL